MQQEEYLNDTGPECNDTGTCENAEPQTLSQLMLFAAGSRARMSVLPDAAQDWLESDPGYGSSSIAFLERLSRAGLSSRMSPACYRLTVDGTLPRSFEGWQTSGIARAGECWTLNTSDWPSDAAVCSLSQVLETDVVPRYFLSAKAARGILCRAAKRGRELPEVLRAALVALAQRNSSTPSSWEMGDR